jgi:uncharacterized protein YdeI (BOF family)
MSNQHYKQRIIKDIQNEDFRIQVTGYVKKIINEDSAILDDKSGEIKLKFKDIDFKLKEDQLITIFGVIDITTSGEKSLVANIIQDKKDLMFEYYQKLYNLKKELDLI